MIVNTIYTPTMLVPDVAAIARQMTSGSQISMVIHRLRKLSLLSFIKVGINNVPFLLLLAKKDFATGVKLLCELEILASPAKQPMWILHNQMTDMAIALGNIHLVRFFFMLAQTYAFAPGILTYNPERCVQFLSNMRGIPENLVFFCPKTSASFEKFAKTTHLQIHFIEGKI